MRVRYTGLLGFTLIELLVVVLIIGILAAVAVPQYQKAVYKSRYATLKNLAKSIANAQEVFYLSNNHYADSFELLDVSMPGGQKEDSTSSQYNYEWGYCYLDSGYSWDQVNCHDTRTSMQYNQRLNHSPAGAGNRMCVAYGSSTDASSIANQVCKAETQSETFFAKSTSENYIAWLYQ
ncbi:MAG: prepilin-type N-terminal cleavage/methylation domain-containing protein [Elusimicrobiaceae bacterium]|nr:prepilin-type N-terminal cleavage/methylation domain-containing protein [Elusimicrobiaceae bacterium]